MRIHTLLLTEFVITQITGLLTLATKCKLVCLHVRHCSECLFAHITPIRMLATIYKLV